jgi:site-specific DNA recombinase
MKRAVIYCRISKDSKKGTEGEGLGVQRQEDDCRALCDRKGWEVVAVKVDNDLSAYSGKTRPEYNEALAMIADGKADAFVSWAWDRVTRYPRELDQFVDVIEKAKAEVALVQAGSVDLTTPSGRFIAKVLGDVARMESEQKAVRQQAANRQRAHAGKRSKSGRRPFGWAEDRLSLHPVEAPAIATAIRDVIAGRSLSSVATEWNANPELRTTTGRKWSNRTVSMLMHRATNPGFAVYQGRILRNVEAEWQPIVTLAEHETVCAVLDSPARKTTPGPRPKHLLTGVAKCGICGSSVYHRIVGSHGVRKHRHVLACKQSRNHGNRSAAPIERAVEEAVLERLSQPDAVELFRAKPRKATKTATAEIERIRALMERTTQDYAAGLINGEQLRQATAAQQEQLTLAQEQLARETAPRMPEQLRAVTPERVGNIWGSLSLADKQSVINTLMTVTIYPADHIEHGALPFGCLIQWR